MLLTFFLKTEILSGPDAQPNGRGFLTMTGHYEDHAYLYR